ncbi:MAG: DUF4468 domain-containing protein [Bacteroidales bacterium]|nr:DUF4468 domain-containing protein [Bacteroidales bacterium]
MFSFMSFNVFAIGYPEMLEYVKKTPFEKEGGEIVFTKIISVDGVSAKELYDRVLPSISYSYQDKNHAEIKVTDEDKLYIVAKGEYKVEEGFNAMFGFSYLIMSKHVVRIDFKDDKLRVVITPEVKINEYRSNGNSDVAHYVASMFPVRPQKKEKLSREDKEDLKIFFSLCLRINSTFENIEKFARKETEW